MTNELACKRLDVIEAIVAFDPTLSILGAICRMCGGGVCHISSILFGSSAIQDAGDCVGPVALRPVVANGLRFRRPSQLYQP